MCGLLLWLQADGRWKFNHGAARPARWEGQLLDSGMKFSHVQPAVCVCVSVLTLTCAAAAVAGGRFHQPREQGCHPEHAAGGAVSLTHRSSEGEIQHSIVSSFMFVFISNKIHQQPSFIIT